MTEGVFRIRPREVDRLREAVAYGLLNVGFAGETAVKNVTPVAGGNRSFNPDGPVGGTLRRSIHIAVYLDGRRISPGGTDENGEALPSYVPQQGLVLFIGTNSGYGFWVHEGTSRMEARPYLIEGWNQVRPQATSLMAAGTRRRLGQ